MDALLLLFFHWVKLIKYILSRYEVTSIIFQTFLYRYLKLSQTLENWLSLWDNWGDERGCDEGHWQAHTRGLPWSLPEVVGTVQQVHCSRRRLLQRILEFHVCTINKSAHTKKVRKLIVCSLYHVKSECWKASLSSYHKWVWSLLSVK